MAKRKKKKGSYEDLNVYQDKSLTVGDYEKIYRTLAKRVNQRLVRLEASGAKTGGMAAVGYLKIIGRKRFKERNKFTEFSDFTRIKKEITIMQGFLRSKRTTKTGRKRILKKTSRTFSKKFDLHLNEETMDHFLNKFEEAKAAAGTPSDMITAILSSVTNEKTTPELIDEIIQEIIDADSLFDAALRVSALEGVAKSATQILNDILDD